VPSGPGPPVAALPAMSGSEIIRGFGDIERVGDLRGEDNAHQARPSVVSLRVVLDALASTVRR
jgi:hypothetical protein